MISSLNDKSAIYALARLIDEQDKQIQALQLIVPLENLEVSEGRGIILLS